MKRYEIDYKMDSTQVENTAFVQAENENEALDKLSEQVSPYFYCLAIRENKEGTLK